MVRPVLARSFPCVPFVPAAVSAVRMIRAWTASVSVESGDVQPASGAQTAKPSIRAEIGADRRKGRAFIGTFQGGQTVAGPGRYQRRPAGRAYCLAGTRIWACTGMNASMTCTGPASGQTGNDASTDPRKTIGRMDIHMAMAAHWSARSLLPCLTNATRSTTRWMMPHAHTGRPGKRVAAWLPGLSKTPRGTL